MTLETINNMKVREKIVAKSGYNKIVFTKTGKMWTRDRYEGQMLVYSQRVNGKDIAAEINGLHGWEIR